MSTLNAKTFEKQFNDYFSKLIYAVFEDIERDWNGDLPHSPLMYQNYKNLCKDKKDRGDGLKNRFTISDPVRQFLTFLFGKMIEEVRNVQLVDGDSIASITEKLEGENAECYTVFMYQVANVLKNEFGETLKAAGDPSLWFHNQIIGFLPQYATKPVLIALISSEFDTFLKAFAWLFGKLLWYYEVTISEQLFLGILAQQGMRQDMLDVLHSSLRAKPAAKPRVRKTASSAASSAANTPSPSAGENTEPKNEPNPVESEAAADKELADMLADV